MSDLSIWKSDKIAHLNIQIEKKANINCKPPNNNLNVAESRSPNFHFTHAPISVEFLYYFCNYYYLCLAAR